MIADMLAVYGNEVAPGMKSARLIAYHISNLLKWWGDKTAAQITMRTCKEFCATRPSQAAIADLKALKAAADYWHKSEYGPLNFQPVFWRPKSNPPKERWLNKREAARLLKAAKPYQHLRRMILLGLHTGSRPGVILALRWDQIDLKAGVMRRLQSGALQDAKKRAPPVKLGRKILGHLRRWKRIDGDREYVCHFEGRAVEDPQRELAQGHQAGKAAGGYAPHAAPHASDVAGTKWRAAVRGSRLPRHDDKDIRVGVRAPSSESVYAHHHPDWQERAANI